MRRYLTKEYRREKTARWRAGNREKYNAAARRGYYRHRDKILRKRTEMVDMLRAIKEAFPCTDCGINYPPYVMDFDHCRGVKRRGINTGNVGKFSLDALAEELLKCDLVCSNCHRIRTHQRGYPQLKNYLLVSEEKVKPGQGREED